VAQEARTQVAAGLRARALTFAVIDALARRGVVPVMLKGFALAMRLYPEQPLGRPSADVDVLIPREQLGEASAAMRDLDLRAYRNTSLADPFEEHHHLSFFSGDRLVEVHFRLFTGFGGGGFDDRAVLARSRASTLEGRVIRLLAPEDEFLYLAVHAANHAFLRVSWLLDLERYLLVSPELDWALIETRARESGFFIAMSTALRLVQELLGVELPPRAARFFSLGRAREAVDRLVFSRRWVVSAELSNNHFASFLLRFWLVDSPAHGVRHLVDGARRVRHRQRSGE
jgi:hypothetical protein